MPIGLQMPQIAKVSRAIHSFLRDLLSPGLRRNKNLLHCHQLRQNTMRCHTLLRKLFGFVSSLAYFVFLSLVLSQYYLTIKRLVLYPIPQPFQLDPSTSTLGTILFVLTSKTGISPLFGYRLLICQPISLRNLFLFLYFLNIVMFQAFLPLPHNYYFTLFFLLFLFFILFIHSDLMGVCWTDTMGQVVFHSHHVSFALLYKVLFPFQILSCRLSLWH